MNQGEANSVSIIVPAFNEEGRVPALLEELAAFASSSPVDCEVLIVDDGSVDRTALVVSEFAKRLPQLKLLSLDRNRGKGFAVRHGVLCANNDIVAFLDADGAYSPFCVLNHLGQFSQGADVVIGSRRIHGTSCSRLPSVRGALGLVFNALVRLLLGMPFKDTQCGFKMFRRFAAKSLFERLDTFGFAFDAEILFSASKAGYNIVEVPVDCRPTSGSRVKLGITPFVMLVGVLKVFVKQRLFGRSNE